MLVQEHSMGLYGSSDGRILCVYAGDNIRADVNLCPFPAGAFGPIPGVLQMTR